MYSKSLIIHDLSLVLTPSQNQHVQVSGSFRDIALLRKSRFASVIQYVVGYSVLIV